MHFRAILKLKCILGFDTIFSFLITVILFDLFKKSFSLNTHLFYFYLNRNVENNQFSGPIPQKLLTITNFRW